MRNDEELYKHDDQYRNEIKAVIASLEQAQNDFDAITIPIARFDSTMLKKLYDALDGLWHITLELRDLLTDFEEPEDDTEEEEE